MAVEPIEQVVERMQVDRAFRMKYCQDPNKTLEAYLSPEEIEAIKTGDGHRLSTLSGGRSWDRLLGVLCGTDPGP